MPQVFEQILFLFLSPFVRRAVISRRRTLVFPDSGRRDRSTTTTRRPRTTRTTRTTRKPTTTTTPRPTTTRRTTRSTRPPRPRTRATAAPRLRPRPSPPPPPPPQASSPQVADPSFSIPGSDRGSWLPGMDLICFSLCFFFLLYYSFGRRSRRRGGGVRIQCRYKVHLWWLAGKFSKKKYEV